MASPSSRGRLGLEVDAVGLDDSAMGDDLSKAAWACVSDEVSS